LAIHYPNGESLSICCIRAVRDFETLIEIFRVCPHDDFCIYKATLDSVVKALSFDGWRLEMRQEFVEIKTADGVMEAFIRHREDGEPFPAVIIYMDIWRVREELYDIARRVGTVGYYCLVPDFYYRQGKRIHFDFRNEKNQTFSINRLDEQKLREINSRTKLTNKMVMDDTGAMLEFLRGAELIRRGGVGAIGFCMGGRYAMCAAGTYPNDFIASASLHGTTLISDRDDSAARASRARQTRSKTRPRSLAANRSRWCGDWNNS
jgi:dienelactone hydrolase